LRFGRKNTGTILDFITRLKQIFLGTTKLWKRKKCGGQLPPNAPRGYGPGPGLQNRHINVVGRSAKQPRQFSVSLPLALVNSITQTGCLATAASVVTTMEMSCEKFRFSCEKETIGSHLMRNQTLGE